MSLPPINELFLKYQGKTDSLENSPVNRVEFSPVKHIDYREEAISNKGKIVEDSTKYAAEAILELSCQINDIQGEAVISDDGSQHVITVINASAEQYENLTAMNYAIPPQYSTVDTDIVTSVNDVHNGIETSRTDPVVTISGCFNESELMNPTVYTMLQNPEMCIQQFESTPRQDATSTDPNSEHPNVIHFVSKNSGQGPYNLVACVSPEKQKSSQNEYISSSNNHYSPNMDLLPTGGRRDETMNLICRSDPPKEPKPNYSFLIGGQCTCEGVNVGDEAPADEVFVKDGQMYRLQDVAVIVIGDLEFYTFIKEKMCFIPLALVYKYTGLVVKKQIEKELASQGINLVGLHENETELLKQKCGLGYRTSLTSLIALDDLRPLCKRLSSVHSNPVLDMIATAPILCKVSGSEMKCCNCGLTTREACLAQYAPVSDVVYGGNEPTQTSNKVPATIGTLLINDASFTVFKIETKLYISVKELILKNIFKIGWLKNRLFKLKCTPRKAPEEIEIHLKSVDSSVQNTLWIDIFHVRCLCLTEKLHFYQRRLDLVKSMTNESYEYSPHTSLSCEKPLEPTPYTIDSTTLEITANVEVESESSASFNIQNVSRTCGRRPKEKVASSHENVQSVEGNCGDVLVDEMSCALRKNNKKRGRPKAFMTRRKITDENIVPDKQVELKRPGEYIIPDKPVQIKSPCEYIVRKKRSEIKSPGEYIVLDKQTNVESTGETQRKQSRLYNPMDKAIPCESHGEHSGRTVVLEKIATCGEGPEHLNSTPSKVTRSSSLVVETETRKRDIEENNNVSNMKQLHMSESGEITIENASHAENNPSDHVRYESKRKSFNPRKFLRPSSEDMVNKNSIEDENLPPDTSSIESVDIGIQSSVKGSRTKHGKDVKKRERGRAESEGQNLLKCTEDASQSNSTSLHSTIEKLKISLSQSPKKGEIAALASPQLKLNVMDLADGLKCDIDLNCEKTIKQENVQRVENCVRSPEAGFSKEATHPRTFTERTKQDVSEHSMCSESISCQLKRERIDSSEKKSVDLTGYVGHPVTQNTDFHSDITNTAHIPVQQPKRKAGRPRKRKRTNTGEYVENKRPRKETSSQDVVMATVKNEEDMRATMRVDMEEKLKQHVVFSLCCDPSPQFKAVGFKPGAEHVFPVLFGPDPQSPATVQLREQFLQCAARFMNKKFLLTVSETWKDVKSEDSK